MHIYIIARDRPHALLKILRIMRGYSARIIDNASIFPIPGCEHRMKVPSSLQEIAAILPANLSDVFLLPDTLDFSQIDWEFFPQCAEHVVVLGESHPAPYEKQNGLRLGNELPPAEYGIYLRNSSLAHKSDFLQKAYRKYLTSAPIVSKHVAAKISALREAFHIQSSIPKFPALYGGTEDVVLTCYFNTFVHPLQGKRWSADHKQLDRLIKSLQGKQLVVFHDCFQCPDTKQVSFVKEECKVSPFFQRWLAYYTWLRVNPQIRKVFCVDATDVVMVRDPFPEMEEGRIYGGVEPTKIGDCQWMFQVHNEPPALQIMHGLHNKPLLNAGILGGHRHDVMNFCRDMFDTGKRKDWQSDMFMFNYLLWGKYYSQLQFGYRVTTLFRSNRGNNMSWWQHK